MRERLNSATRVGHENEDDVLEDDARPRVGPGKLTSGDLAAGKRGWLSVQPSSGKVRRSDVGQEHTSAPEALALADQMLSVDRGWGPVSRKAEAVGDIADDGAISGAFAFIAEAERGQPLAPELRARLEVELGVGLEGVRVHTDAAAAAAAAQLRARAFTIGTDIYFASGAYDPEDQAGVELIAHEAAHVAQNLRGQTPGRRLSRPDEPHEQQADDFARRFAGRSRGLTDSADPAEVVEKVRRAGQRLDLPGLPELERELGASLAHVEAFTGEAAAAACKWMQAGAFAVRNIVAFADPSPRREQLMHELAHVIQSGADRAPTRFVRGSLRVGPGGTDVERDAWSAVGGAGVQARADAHTIHRDDGTGAASEKPWTLDAALERWRTFLGKPVHKKLDLAGVGARAVRARAAFGKKHAKGYIRYKQTSEKPILLGDYARALALDTATVSRDLKELHRKSQAEARIFKVGGAGGQRWAWIADAGAAEPIAYLHEERRKAPDPDKSFRSVAAGVIRLQGEGFLADFTSVQLDGNEIILDPDRDTAYTEDEAKAAREALRERIADEPKFAWTPDQHWEVFLAKVVKPALFEQGLQGAAFGRLVQANLASAGYTVSQQEVLFYDERFQSDKLKRRGDGFSTQGAKTIAEFKSGQQKAPSEGDDAFKQAQDYYLITSGTDHSGTRGKKPKAVNPSECKEIEFDDCVYVFTTPDIAKDWAPRLEKAFGGDKTKLKIFPPVDGFLTIPIKTNPTFQVPLTNKDATSHTIADPFFHAGIKVSQAKLQTKAPGSSELVSGSLELQTDLAGAITSGKQTKQITPEPGGVGGTFDGKLDKIKTSLGTIFKRIEPNIRITDNGVEGELEISAGPSGLPSINLSESKLAVKYGNDGDLSVTGDIELAHTNGKLSAKAKVEWTGGSWKISGEVTLEEGMVDGLSNVTGTVNYENGKWKLGIKEAAYTKKLQAITLTGKVYGCEYDVDAKSFSGYAQLEADLGMFGSATASAELKNNKLTNAELSYDSPDFQYPAKSDKPSFKGTVGGTLRYQNDKFSGSIRGTANVNIPALQKLAGESGVGLAVHADVGADGSYSGTIATTTPLTFGKHVQIPSLSCTIGKEGDVSGSFELRIVKIKFLDEAKIKCTVTKDGIEIEDAKVEAPFGTEGTDKFWGKVSVGYNKTTGLAIGGTVNYEIKKGMVATGELTYSTETNEVSLAMTVSEITLLDKQVSKTLFKATKQIPIVSVYGLGIYIDIGFELGFDFGFKLGLKPTVDFEGLSLETFEFKKIAAQIELLGELSAKLTGTPKLGLGIFALDPKVLRGGGGLKVPIVGEAKIKPTGKLEVSYTPDGQVDGDAKVGMNMTFGITGSVKPYAEFAVLDGLWNPTWDGDALTQFEILPPKELFNFVVDLGGDLEKQEAPALPECDAANDPSPPEADKLLPEEKGQPTEKSGPAAAREEEGPKAPPDESGEEGQFSLSALAPLLEKLPGAASVKKVLEKAGEVWDQIKGFFGRIVGAFKSFFEDLTTELEEILDGFAKEGLGYVPKLVKKIVGDTVYEIIEPLVVHLSRSTDALLELFETDPPTDMSDFMPWVWRVADRVFDLGASTLTGFVAAFRDMWRKMYDVAKKLITKAVADGWIGVKRHAYYIWRPWPVDDYHFIAASEFKLTIPGITALGKQGPTGFLLSPESAIAVGLYTLLEEVGVPVTYRGWNQRAGEPYNDRWTGAGARG